MGLLAGVMGYKAEILGLGGIGGVSLCQIGMCFLGPHKPSIVISRNHLSLKTAYKRKLIPSFGIPFAHIALSVGTKICSATFFKSSSSLGPTFCASVSTTTVTFLAHLVRE